MMLTWHCVLIPGHINTCAFSLFFNKGHREGTHCRCVSFPTKASAHAHTSTLTLGTHALGCAQADCHATSWQLDHARCDILFRQQRQAKRSQRKAYYELPNNHGCGQGPEEDDLPKPSYPLSCACWKEGSRLCSSRVRFWPYPSAQRFSICGEKVMPDVNFTKLVESLEAVSPIPSTRFAFLYYTRVKVNGTFPCVSPRR